MPLLGMYATAWAWAAAHMCSLMLLMLSAHGLAQTLQHACWLSLVTHTHDGHLGAMQWMAIHQRGGCGPTGTSGLAAFMGLALGAFIAFLALMAFMAFMAFIVFMASFMVFMGLACLVSLAILEWAAIGGSCGVEDA